MNAFFYRFLILELCKATVSDYIKGAYEGPMPAEPSALSQMASGLHYIHGKRFVHRDIKPANVLVSVAAWRITLKISDFGFCKPISPNQSFSVTEGQPKGTRIYFAPEYLQLSTEEVENVRANVSVDVFSLGCVFFNYVTRGDHLFAKPGTQPLTNEHVTENIRNGNKFLEDPQSKLKRNHFAFEMIDGMTQADPHHRWKLDEVIHILEINLE